MTKRFCHHSHREKNTHCPYNNNNNNNNVRTVTAITTATYITEVHEALVPMSWEEPTLLIRTRLINSVSVSYTHLTLPTTASV